MTAGSSNVPASRRWAASILQIFRFGSGLLVVALGMAAHDFADAQERKKIVVAYVAASEQMIIPALDPTAKTLQPSDVADMGFFAGD